jgi:hypothetical protein
MIWFLLHVGMGWNIGMCCTERQGDIDGGIKCDERLTERYIVSDWRNNQTDTDTLDLAILAWVVWWLGSEGTVYITYEGGETAFPLQLCKGPFGFHFALTDFHFPGISQESRIASDSLWACLCADVMSFQLFLPGTPELYNESFPLRHSVSISWPSQAIDFAASLPGT